MSAIYILIAFIACLTAEIVAVFFALWEMLV